MVIFSSTVGKGSPTIRVNPDWAMELGNALDRVGAILGR